MIEVAGLSKTFLVSRRPAGLKAAARSLFHREYNRIAALQDVSFQIAPGEIVGYIGPNGAGKSTTIKVMSGILVPDSGECRIMGRTPWRERIAHVQKIGVVFGQRSQLWWDVPVIDSFELLRDIYRVAPREYRENLDRLTAALDLGEIINQPTRQLSLGQRMRCEIAAALLHSPELLFLDEPTIGLDAGSKLAVRRFIRQINREKRVTVILTTHDMNDIEALAERVILIGKGRILYDGNLGDLRNRFGSTKTIKLDFKETGLRPPELAGVAWSTWTAEQASLTVNTQETNVSAVLADLAAQLELLDVTVENPPIEEVVLQLYREYRI